MTSSNGNISRVTGHLCGEFTGPRWIPRTKGQWRGALMFSLIYARIKGWVNTGEAGDLRRHHAHYDVTVMRKWNLHLQINCADLEVRGYKNNSWNDHQSTCPLKFMYISPKSTITQLICYVYNIHLIWYIFNGQGEDTKMYFGALWLKSVENAFYYINLKGKRFFMQVWCRRVTTGPSFN